MRWGGRRRKRGGWADLVIEIGADDALVVFVPPDHKQPGIGPLGLGLAFIPSLVLIIDIAAPAGLDGVVVEDDGEASGGEGSDDGVVDLQGGLAAELGVGSDPGVLDGDCVLDHLAGEGEADGVDAGLLHRVEDVVDGDILEAKGEDVRVLAGVAVVVKAGIAVAGPRAARAVPVGGPELEAVALGIDDVAAAGAEGRGPRGEGAERRGGAGEEARDELARRDAGERGAGDGEQRDVRRRRYRAS